jgi:hypothetical protein
MSGQLYFALSQEKGKTGAMVAIESSLDVSGSIDVFSR